MKKYFVPFVLDKTEVVYEDFVKIQYSGTHYTLNDSWEWFETKELALEYVSKHCNNDENTLVFVILEVYVSV